MSRARMYTDEQFIEAVKNSFSVCQTLKKLGLKEAGGNYKSAKEKIINLKIVAQT